MKCQLESILNQTFQNWELLIRDDGSTDDTLAIIERYCREDSRINCIEHIASDQDGPKENFNILLGHALDSSANLIMFCDQDDYWHPDKIQTYFDLASVKNGPHLIYSDFELVDSQLMPIDATHSFKNALNGGVDGTITDFLSLNHIPGCCIAINRELAMVASPIPVDAIMHDWWLALTAASIGELLYIDNKADQVPATRSKYSGCNFCDTAGFELETMACFVGKRFQKNYARQCNRPTNWQTNLKSRMP